jgi:hypothetical protein
MPTHDSSRVTLTCARCAFLASLDKPQIALHGWHVPNEPGSPVLCPLCVKTHHAAPSAGDNPARLRP